MSTAHLPRVQGPRFRTQPNVSTSPQPTILIERDNFSFMRTLCTVLLWGVHEPPKIACKVLCVPASFCGPTTFIIFSKGSRPKDRLEPPQVQVSSTAPAPAFSFSLFPSLRKETLSSTQFQHKSHPFLLPSKTSPHRWSHASTCSHFGACQHSPHLLSYGVSWKTPPHLGLKQKP